MTELEKNVHVAPHKPIYIELDEAGRITLPPELISEYNIKSGGKVLLVKNPASLSLQIPSRLEKLYIEPTNQCNLDCRTCIRNTWDEPQGMMSEEVFSRVLEGLEAFNPVPRVFFGGFGEPLFHPDIIKMITRVKALGAPVELITNGTLLTQEMSEALIDLKIDTLWVSLDGATPESYTDIRLGAALFEVLKNLNGFKKSIYEKYGSGGACSISPKSKTNIGITFVAMKRNIKDLPAVIRIGYDLGAEKFMVSNVLPYTRDMISEALYYRSINSDYRFIDLPDIDTDESTYKPVYDALRELHSSWAGFNPQGVRDYCPFIMNGAGVVGWNGDFSPCLALLHSHMSYLGYLHKGERFSRKWSLGNVIETRLIDLWNTPEHLAFRARVQNFDFPPCTSCGSCEMAEKNEEDCYGNPFPTCGGCLWAQGVIQCP